MRHPLLSTLAITSLSLLCCGCPPKLADGPGQEGKPEQVAPPAEKPAEKPVVKTDDPEAAAALVAAGAVLKKDAAGNVTAIDCEKVAITDAQLPLLKGFPHLQVVSLYNGEITDSGLAILEQLPPLTELSLRRCNQITAAGLEHLKHQPELQRLLLLYTRTTNDGLTKLAPLTKLRALDLRGCNEVGDAGLESLVGLDALIDLKLRADGITDAGMKSVGKMKNLQQLTIEDCRVTSAGLAELEGLTKLRQLNANRTYVSDKGMKHLAGAKLQDLRLRETAVLGSGLKDLKESIPTLVTLDLSEVLIPNEGLAEIAPFKNLKYLSLWNGSMDDEGIAHLVGLDQLEELVLNGCPNITSASADSFIQLPKLAKLNLAETGFDDEGLEKLVGLKSLKELTISLSGVSDQGVEKFRAARPDVTVSQ